MVRDLNSILGYIDSLNELDTANVPPMAQVSDRYGVDESKQGSERFAYASREDILEGLRKCCRMKSRWPTRRIRMERFSKCRK